MSNKRKQHREQQRGTRSVDDKETHDGSLGDSESLGVGG